MIENRFPLWKNLLVLTVFVVALIYALPNFFGSDPAVQISPTRAGTLDDAKLQRIDELLQQAGLNVKRREMQDKRLLLRFTNTDEQLKAADLLRAEWGNQLTIALNLASATPAWLRGLGAQPMYLGLDLRGGVHFLLEVDMAAAIKQAEERYAADMRSLLRERKLRYQLIAYENGAIRAVFKTAEDRDAALPVIHDQLRGLVVVTAQEDNPLESRWRLSEVEQREIKRFALEQNITTLRNRINELGVAEPVIQQQGDQRIVVQLPGVQDTALAKEILGATATLEFRLVDVEHDVGQALKGAVPIGSRLYRDRQGNPLLLQQRIIVTGDQIVDASSGLDQGNGTPSVFVTLNGVGAKKMGQTTQENIGKPMAVVFIEQKTETRVIDGEVVKKKVKTEEVINVATIRDSFSKRFQITGLDSTQEARTLALLLRAGALAAPVDIVEERTVGPSLGQDNIDQGTTSALIGFVLVVLFMAFYYKVFGLIADVALLFNAIIIVAVLSLLQATLTLPGIAGIALTLGMAVDANVLIYERIKEELRNGTPPQTAIYLGYERAFATIFDSNITTLLAALVLFGFGSGPVKGFAVTLSIGILTSMFTAILGTRMFVNLFFGQRRVAQLPI